MITIAGPYADSLSSAYEDPLREFLEEKFAISFVPLQIDDANASYAYRLRAAANEFPDIMLYDAQWDFLYFIQANSLRALPDVMSDYPHLRQYITYPYAKNLQYDGKIWGIPRSLYAEEQRLPGYCVLVYKEYLAQTGVEEPVTMEDWQAFFRAIREANPDVIPLAAQSPWAMFNFSYFYAPVRQHLDLGYANEQLCAGLLHPGIQPAHCRPARAVGRGPARSRFYERELRPALGRGSLFAGAGRLASSIPRLSTCCNRN